jgi:NADPH:quinone reductase
VGDRVLAVCPRGGAFAEEAVLPASACVRLPPGVPLVQAAGLAVAYGTADLALTVRAGLAASNGPTHTVLISGAGGGVGAAAVQLAIAAGAAVIALARGTAKADALRRLVAEGTAGATGAAPPRLTVIDPDALPPGTPRLRDAIAAAAGGPRRVSIFLDNVGGSVFEEGLRSLRWGGHALVVGFASGRIPSIPANALLLQSVRVDGVYWGPTARHEPVAFKAGLERLVGLLGSGGLSVPVSHAVPLEGWVEGWAALGERRAFGKVVLTMEGGRGSGHTGGRAKL